MLPLDVVLPINRGFCPWNLVMVGSQLLTLPMPLIYFFSHRYMEEFGVIGDGAAIK